MGAFGHCPGDTVLPDMRGFGNSDKPKGQSAYENAAMARDVVALIRHLHLESVDIVGFSMGTGPRRAC
jgi:pimeloyl-ACP methyl ester carboxylesterase